MKKFKDGQINVSLSKEIKGVMEVAIRGNTYEDLFVAAAYKNAIDFSYKKETQTVLNIMCLIGQRSDRRFGFFESFDLQVVTDFINSLNYDIVQVFHPHSEAAIGMIRNSIALSPLKYIEKSLEDFEDCSTLVSPDAGAYKSVKEYAELLGVDVVAANKIRVNGEPKIEFASDVKDKNLLIVDDLADGGRTFVALAKELKAQGANEVRLYVSHGMFHYGFDEIKKEIDHVYCSNSYRDIEDDFVTQFQVIQNGKD
jgi:ribose-phosphate pyrophosphokinase